MEKQPHIVAQFIGGPKTITDERGTYRTSIWRDEVSGPVMLEKRGFVGDKATQPFHGQIDQAVCIHLNDHYRFWNATYGMDLKAGGVGENWTLDDITEDQLCIGDIYRVGGAVVQVSAPRMPCNTQGRRVGRADWVKLSIKENRTGAYLRVLEEGEVSTGDGWSLTERQTPEATITALNNCLYHDFDPAFAERMIALPTLMGIWQDAFAKRLS